jgi:hypothetical protein
METKLIWVNEKEVSRITGFALPTLRNDRHLGKGIPYAKRRRSVRYCLKDVYAYMDKRRVDCEG